MAEEIVKTDPFEGNPVAIVVTYRTWNERMTETERRAFIVRAKALGFDNWFDPYMDEYRFERRPAV